MAGSSTLPAGLQVGPGEAFTPRFLQREVDQAQGIALFSPHGRAARAVATLVRELGLRRGASVLAHPTHDLATALARASGGVLHLRSAERFSDDSLLKLHVALVRAHKAALATVAKVVTTSFTDVRALEAKSSIIGDLPLFYVDQDEDVHEVLTLPPASASSFSADLAFINGHRRQIGMRPLEPRVAGWTDEDVALEAARLRRLSNPRAACLHW